MNFKYPEYNFDEWLYQFICLIEYGEDTLAIQEALIESTEAFIWQLHSHAEDEYDKCDKFLEYLILFNKFNKLIAYDPIELADIVAFFIEHIPKYKGTEHIKGIAKCITLGHIYKTRKHTFTPALVYKITEFLDILQIPYNR